MKKPLLLVAAAFLVLVTAVLVTELQEPPSQPQEPTSPLTDVAGAAPVLAGRPVQPASPRPVEPSRPAPPAVPQDAPASGPPVPEAPQARSVPPSLMPDVANPPQWTRPLAVPSTPTPPNPFEPPPIAVDPERGRAPPPVDGEPPAP